MRFVEDWLEVPRLWGATRVRLDDVERVEGRRVFVRGGRPLTLKSEQARALGEVLDGPARDATPAATIANIAAHLSGPHAPARTARRLLELAAMLGASDLHLEAAVEESVLRLRIAGELREVARLERGAADRLVAAWKSLASCLAYRRDLAQEGRIPRGGVCADVRASFVPTAFGERVALRLFGRLRTLEQLGASPRSLAEWSRLLEQRTGLLLVAGPSGAGKTTTLYASLAHVASQRGGAHVSIEDPVEQRLRAAGIPVDQLEVDDARGLTAEALLAATLRQDVDVLCVGELRSRAEVTLALQAARTGRLVLAGIHAGSPAEARQRLLDLGAEPALVEMSLRGVMQQELASADCDCASNPACERCAGAGKRRVLRASVEVLRAAASSAPLKEVA